MVRKWKVPLECLDLPGDNLEKRYQVAEQLIQLLKSPPRPAPENNRRGDWTLWIKESLYSVLDHEDLDISPIRADSTRGEYLTLDITVEEKRFPKRIVLAVESELDDSRHRKSEILNDFEKLLGVKSAFKLMIFSSQKRGFDNDEIRQNLVNDLRCYGHHLKGETYMFVDYNEDSGRNGSFIAHIWQSHSSSVPAEAELQMRLA